jgi:hypothetical protein
MNHKSTEIYQNHGIDVATPMAGPSPRIVSFGWKNLALTRIVANEDEEEGGL